MIKRNYKRLSQQVEKRRFRLLLIATLLVLIMPAFFAKGLLSTILFVVCMSFLLIQSLIISDPQKSKYSGWRYIILVVLILLFWLEPIGYKSKALDIIRFVMLVGFFVFVTFYLLKFLRRAKDVNIDVIMVSINIYLLLGICAGSLSFLLYQLNPDSYNIPSYITNPSFVTFNYYSFITMSTVGYGDITPRLPETQTIAYLVSVTGQLYVAIIVAFLVGKLLIKADKG